LPENSTKWDARLPFTSPDETTGVLEIKIQADSVDTGSDQKNGKLKGKNFFDVERYPQIAFKSTKIVKTATKHMRWMAILRIRGSPTQRS
jgi:polyisoprenoid-binding protein YceI